MLGRCLSAPGTCKYILPAAQSTSVDHLFLYATCWSTKSTPSGSVGEKVDFLKHSLKLALAVVLWTTITLSNPGIHSFCIHLSWVDGPFSDPAYNLLVEQGMHCNCPTEPTRNTKFIKIEGLQITEDYTLASNNLIMDWS
jgi:hypothetical protein